MLPFVPGDEIGEGEYEFLIDESFISSIEFVDEAFIIVRHGSGEVDKGTYRIWADRSYEYDGEPYWKLWIRTAFDEYAYYLRQTDDGQILITYYSGEWGADLVGIGVLSGITVDMLIEFPITEAPALSSEFPAPSE